MLLFSSRGNSLELQTQYFPFTKVFWITSSNILEHSSTPPSCSAVFLMIAFLSVTWHSFLPSAREVSQKVYQVQEMRNLNRRHVQIEFKNYQLTSSVSLAVCALLPSNGLFGNKLVPPPICSSCWPPATSASVLSCLQDVIQLHLLPYPFVSLSKWDQAYIFLCLSLQPLTSAPSF